MEMTNEEICRNFRQARDKAEQIAVLADLNCCKRTEIREILIAGGEELNEAVPDEKLCSAYLLMPSKKRQNWMKKQARLKRCTVEEIRNILIDGGALVPASPKKAEAAVPEVPVRNPEAVPADWKTSLKVLTERITELKQIRDNAEKELLEIYEAVGSLCGKE